MPTAHTTIFSSREFVERWCRAYDGCRPFPVEVRGSGPPRFMYLIQRAARLGTYRVSGCQSLDLWSSPGWTGELERATVQHSLRQIRGHRTLDMQWQVRFDHAPLAALLTTLGLDHVTVPIHVLELDPDPSRVFARYHATARNQIRKAERRGVTVRSSTQLSDILAYQAIYAGIAKEKKWRSIYPAQLTRELLELTEDVCFKVAEHEGAVIGGALFIRDASSVYYLHGVSDRRFSDLFPTRLILDAGIQWACGIGAEFFNLGNSGNNRTLAEFKASWGSRVESNWIFDWENPAWNRARAVRRRARGVASRIVWRPGTPGSLPEPIRQDSSKPPSHATAWSERARLGELASVCDASGDTAKNLIMHGATLVTARMTLAEARKRGLRRPTILDLGCGSGRMLRFFGERGCRVAGLDVTLEMVLQANRYGLPEGSGVAQFDGKTLPLLDRSADIVWISGVLKYTLFPPGSRCLHGIVQADKFVPSCDEVARELYRVLKPGGIVVNHEMWIDEPPHMFTPSFEGAGYTTERVRLMRTATDGILSQPVFRRMPGWLLLKLAELRAHWLYRFGDAQRPGFRDYVIIWRKPEAVRATLPSASAPAASRAPDPS